MSREKIVATALTLGAIKLSVDSPFCWASGYRMPIYNDNRLLLGDYKARQLVTEALAGLISEHSLRPEIIAGTATAGIAPATSLADKLKLPLSYVRSGSKDHGLKKQIEGTPVEGKRVVLIEDVISTGGSSLEAARALQAAGAQVVAVLASFTYGFAKAEDAFDSASIPHFAVLHYDEVVEVVSQQGSFDESSLEKLRLWRKDPFGWGEAQGFPKE